MHYLSTLSLLLSLFFSLFTSNASAHSASTSAVFINMDNALIEADIYLPLDQLYLADSGLFDYEAMSLNALNQQTFTAYMLAHVNITTASGQKLVNRVSSNVELNDADGVAFLTVHMQFVKPIGFQDTAVYLHFNAILHRVVSHKIYVSLSHDFNEVIKAKQNIATLGIIHYQHKQLRIEQSKGNYWSPFKLMFINGMQHIASGVDHLLFLFCLLLPAPLLSRKKRWIAVVPLRQCVMSVVKIVTCFTLGHSLTLALATLGYTNIAAKPIEVLVAASILISAVHAMRPVFGQTAGLIALSFGLIHGLAFASEMSHMGFDSNAVVLALIAFNLGIETVQLMIVFSVVPLLVWLARTRYYTGFRYASSIGAIGAASLWLIQRSL